MRKKEEQRLRKVKINEKGRRREAEDSEDI